MLGFERVPVALCEALYMAIFQVNFFGGGYGRPKDYVTVVSSSLGNFHIMKNLVSNLKNKHFCTLEVVISRNQYNFGIRHALDV